MKTLIATATKTTTKRTAQATRCPSCGTNGQTTATTVTCNSCGLVAPRKAFQDAATAARTWGQPRAFTSRGNID